MGKNVDLGRFVDFKAWKLLRIKSGGSISPLPRRVRAMRVGD